MNRIYSMKFGVGLILTMVEIPVGKGRWTSQLQSKFSMKSVFRLLHTYCYSSIFSISCNTRHYFPMPWLVGSAHWLTCVTWYLTWILIGLIVRSVTGAARRRLCFPFQPCCASWFNFVHIHYDYILCICKSKIDIPNIAQMFEYLLS
jgi:hypothetical protein